MSRPRLLEQLGYDLVARLAAGLRELVVELLGTVGRSVALHGDVLRGTVVLQVLVDVLLEVAQVGVLLVLLRHDRRVDGVEQIGLVYDRRHALVVVGHLVHQVAVLQILLKGVQTVGYDQTELTLDGLLGSGVVAGQHGSLLLGGNGARVEVHQRELLALAAGALDLGAELQCALVHAGIVGELHVLRVDAAVLLVDDGVVVVDLRTLEDLGSAGYFAALEYDDGGHLHDGLLVEVGLGEGHVDVGRYDAVVQRQDLGRYREVDLVAVLGHLLEAVTARQRQRGSHEYNAQLHEFFHST